MVLSNLFSSKGTMKINGDWFEVGHVTYRSTLQVTMVDPIQVTVVDTTTSTSHGGRHYKSRWSTLQVSVVDTTSHGGRHYKSRW